MPPVAGGDVVRMMQWVLRVAILGLLLLGDVRLLLSGGESWRLSAGLALSVALAAIYLAGVRASEEHPERRRSRWWLSIVTTLWVGLLVTHSEFAWLAFPLFFMHMSILQVRHALVAITMMLVAVIGGLGHARGLSAGVIMGPALGAVVAVLVSLGYRALHDESARRLAALEELRQTRDELARTNREAGRLAERERLAREIHDTLAQGLSSLVLLSRGIDRQLGQIDRGDQSGATGGEPDHLAEARTLAHRAEATASSNLAEARRFVRALTPASLASRSLPEALSRLIAEQQERYPGTVWEFHLDGDPEPLATEVEVTLLRAAQASLANVAQHAGASRSVCSLAFGGGEVTVDVVDDGCGFDPTQPPGPDSFGLSGLRRRVEAAGGSCEVESEPGRGTAVALRFPTGRGGSGTTPAPEKGPAQ